MPSKLLALYKRQKSAILYLVFGGLTTLINIFAYWVCERTIGLSTAPSTIIAWIVAVLFAFVTNKIFVFESKTFDLGRLLVELGGFVLARLISGSVDLGVMMLGVDVMYIDSMIVKVLSNIIVVILNYIASKYFIFKKKKNKTNN